jgi:FMN reductase
MNVIGLLGSPSPWSRSAWLLERACKQLKDRGAHVTPPIALRELPAQPLLAANSRDPQIEAATQQLRAADVVLIATPIYKAAYSGLLKAFLDLLPPDGLAGKTVLALGTGGSAGHLLAIDYALKPVLNALGARHIVDTVFAVEAQLVPHETRGYVPDEALLQRLHKALDGLFVEPAAWRATWRPPVAAREPHAPSLAH